MRLPEKPTLLAAVFMDYICPFCYVGDVRLDRLREEARALYSESERACRNGASCLGSAVCRATPRAGRSDGRTNRRGGEHAN
jgi:hypothetical protein